MAESQYKSRSVQRCRTCASELVQAQDWIRVDDDSWHVILRCPECFSTDQVDLDQEGVNELSYTLESGFRVLLDLLEQLDQEAFEQDCEIIMRALQADCIYPMDF